MTVLAHLSDMGSQADPNCKSCSNANLNHVHNVIAQPLRSLLALQYCAQKALKQIGCCSRSCHHSCLLPCHLQPMYDVPSAFNNGYLCCLSLATSTIDMGRTE